jgi:predicted HTH transcriptional regulator
MHPKVTANDLSEILNINLRNTKKIIEKLKEKGLVKRIGSRKTGYWEVVGR